MRIKKPHIIIINPDQWRGDVLGHMGNPAAVTPHLDQAVENDFVSFRRAFCQNPVCTPSRYSFMTGWYPSEASTRGNTSKPGRRSVGRNCAPPTTACALGWTISSV
ncbi:MAG: sulfatase-like hydrolase/transferase [Bacteroidota bacterium]